MPINHQLTATTPDNPAYEIRPSAWNSEHVVALVGSEVIGAFSNGGNVSFSTNGAGYIQGTVNVPAAYLSSLNGSSGAVSLNAGSSLSASTNGSSITFGLASNITTALQSAGAYLTTAAQSNHSHGFSAAGGSSAFQTLSFSNGNGVSFTNTNGQVGASVATTYRASNDAVGLNSAVSNVTATINSAGLSLDARGYAGTATAVTGGAAVTLNSGGLSFNGASLAGTSSGFTGANVSATITHNTAGLALSMSVAAPGGGGNFSAGVSNVGNTGGQTGVSGTRMVLVGSQNITLNQATDANGLTVSISGGAGAAGNTGFISAGAATASLGTVVFSNSNGVSFGANGQTITASHNGLTSQSNQAASAANGSFAFQTVSFSNANGVSFVTSAGSAIVASVNTSYAASNHSHGNPTLALTNLSGTTASNSAGLTLSLSAAAAGGAASATNYFTGNTTQGSSGTAAVSSLLFRGAGIVSVGQSNGSVLISTPDPVTVTDMSVGISGGNTSGHTGTVANGQVVFAGGNNVTLSGSTNGSSMTITISAANGGGGGGVGAGISSLGNTAGTSGMVTTGNIVFVGSGPVSLSQSSSGSNATISINAPAVSSLVAGANITVSTAGSTISIIGATVAASPLSLSAGASSDALQSIVFSNSNGVSFGLNGSTVTGSVAAQTNQSIGGYFVGNTTGQSSSSTVDARSLSIDGAGIVSAGWSNGTIRISATQSVQTQASGDIARSGFTSAGNNIGLSGTLNSGGLSLSATVAAQSVQPVAVSGANGSYAFSTLSMSNANGISFGTSAGSAITASHNALTSQSNQALSAANGSFAFQTANFSNANGVSFITSAGSAIAASVETSYAASNHSHGNPTLNLTNLSGTTASNSAGFTLSLSAAAPGGGGVTPVVSANNGSYSFTTLSFSNANGISFGTSAGSAVSASYTVPSVTQYFSATNTTFNGANISGSMTNNTNGLQLSLSVAAPGAAAENNNMALLGANTAGNTTASGSTIGWSGQGVTLSGTNGSQIVISAPPVSSLVGAGCITISTDGSTISISAPGAGTATMWQPFNEALNVAGQQGNAIMHIVPLPTPTPAALGELQVDRLCLPLIISNSSNSTGSVTVSHSFGLYTKNASTLSLLMSTSYTAAATFSGTVNNSTFAGLRLHTVPWTTTIGDGRYYVAQWSRTTTGGGNCTVNQWLVSQANSNYSGIFGSNSNRSQQYPLGYGAYSVSFSTAMPSSIAISAIDGTGSLVARPPSFFMINGTA